MVFLVNSSVVLEILESTVASHCRYSTRAVPRFPPKCRALIAMHDDKRNHFTALVSLLRLEDFKQAMDCIRNCSRQQPGGRSPSRAKSSRGAWRRIKTGRPRMAFRDSCERRPVASIFASRRSKPASADDSHAIGALRVLAVQGLYSHRQRRIADDHLDRRLITTECKGMFCGDRSRDDGAPHLGRRI